MPDSTENRGPQDRSRVSMEQDHEVDYWTGKFGVSREQLQQAVEAVGNSADEVGGYLKKG